MTVSVDNETMDAVLDHIRRRGHIVVDTVPSELTGLKDCEFHVVAWDEAVDTMAFIRVTQCPSKNPCPESLVVAFSPTAERLRKARRDAGKWCRDRHVDWKGVCRFDRIEVYGTKRRVFDWTRNVEGKL